LQPLSQSRLKRAIKKTDAEKSMGAMSPQAFSLKETLEQAMPPSKKGSWAPLSAKKGMPSLPQNQALAHPKLHFLFRGEKDGPMLSWNDVNLPPRLYPAFLKELLQDRDIPRLRGAPGLKVQLDLSFQPLSAQELSSLFSKRAHMKKNQPMQVILKGQQLDLSDALKPLFPATLKSLSMGYNLRYKGLQALKHTALQELSLKWMAIEDLVGTPDGLHQLTIAHCPFLQTLRGAPGSLKKLSLIECSDMVCLREVPESVEELTLAHFQGVMRPKDFPFALKKLTLISCHRLSSLHLLPQSLSHLTLIDCEGVSSLEGIPEKLQLLHIDGCPISETAFMPSCMPDSLELKRGRLSHAPFFC
jgi:hypothetical protein